MSTLSYSSLSLLGSRDCSSVAISMCSTRAKSSGNLSSRTFSIGSSLTRERCSSSLIPPRCRVISTVLLVGDSQYGLVFLQLSGCTYHHRVVFVLLFHLMLRVLHLERFFFSLCQTLLSSCPSRFIVSLSYPVLRHFFCLE